MGKQIKNLVGKRFGRLKVINLSDQRNKFGHIMWNCLCDCGNYHTTSRTHLENGTKSCGCLALETRRKIKHGDNRVNKRTRENSKRD